jgi:4-amino-4-deoxy-L-arabinose transferase-like glycosyltransferase
MSSGPSQRRILFLIITAIIILGFILRVYKSDYSLFGDEFFTLQVITSSFQSLINDLKMDLHPPLFFCMVKIISTWVSGEVGLRLVSIFAGTLALIGIYLFCMEAISKRIGIIAMAMAALSPLAISYSQEARQYSLLFCLTVWSSYFIFRWLVHKNKFDFIGFVLCSAIGFYTHYFYVLTFIVQFIWFWTAARSLDQRKKLLFGSVFIAICFLPWIIDALPTQLAFKATVERPRGGILFLAKQFAEMTVGNSFFYIDGLTESREPSYKDIIINLIPVILVVASFGYLLLVGLIRLGRSLNHVKYLLLGLLVFPISFMVLLNFISIGSFLSTKYVIATLFPFLVLLSLGIEASLVERRILNSGATILAIALSLLSIERYYYERDMYGRWENWKDCYAYIHDNFPADKSTTILLQNSDKRQISYYLPDYVKYNIVSLKSDKLGETRIDPYDIPTINNAILMINMRTTMSNHQNTQSIVSLLQKRYSVESELIFGKRLSLSILKNQGIIEKY